MYASARTRVCVWMCATSIRVCDMCVYGLCMRLWDVYVCLTDVCVWSVHGCMCDVILFCFILLFFWGGLLFTFYSNFNIFLNFKICSFFSLTFLKICLFSN